MVMAKEKRPLIKAFISSVKSHPCIWNKDDPHYKHTFRREQAFENILRDLNSRFSQERLIGNRMNKVRRLKIQWQHLRDSYLRRARRNQENEKSSEENKCTSWKVTWMFHNQLKFLGSGSEEGQLESSSCLEPDLEENEVGEEDEEEYEQDEVLDESESVFLVEEPSHEPSAPTRKRCRPYRPSHEPEIVVEQVESMSTNRLDEFQDRQEILSIERQIAEATLRHQRERQALEVKRLQMELEKQSVIRELEVETAKLNRDRAQRRLDQSTCFVTVVNQIDNFKSH